MTPQFLNLSIEDKAAQLLMPSLHPERYLSDEQYRADTNQLIESGVGGFCVFQGDMEQTAQIIAELQAQADVPLLFSADYEHGLPMRLDGGTDFPHAMALGIGRDTGITRRIATAIAREAKAIGINWNFAPVCDINSNKRNPIINIRSFGENIGEVIPQITAWIEGTQMEHVVACAKHFPGHGDAGTDSHIDLPLLELSRERLTSLELVPFLAAIREGVKSVMVAHLAVPAFDATQTPASLSRPIITDVLRNYMKFDGIIITDALDMKSITRRYTSSEAVLKAVQAGADVALVPENAKEAMTALRNSVMEGALTEQRIQESYERIVQLKNWCGLLSVRAHKQDPISLEEHGMLALKAATNAPRVSGDDSLLPVEQYSHLACFAFLSDDDIDPASEFFHYLAQVYEKNTDIAYLNAGITDAEIEEYRQSTLQSECVVFAVFARVRSYSDTVQIHERLLKAAGILGEGKPRIAVLFGNPYLDETFPADVFIKCFSDSKPSRGAACLALSKKSLNL